MPRSLLDPSLGVFPWDLMGYSSRASGISLQGCFLSMSLPVLPPIQHRGAVGVWGQMLIFAQLQKRCSGLAVSGEAEMALSFDSASTALFSPGRRSL